jgi:hypothetical protein
MGREGRSSGALDPEIQLVTGWLTAWGTAPAPTGMPGMTDGTLDM